MLGEYPIKPVCANCNDSLTGKHMYGLKEFYCYDNPKMQMQEGNLMMSWTLEDIKLLFFLCDKCYKDGKAKGDN